MAEVAHILLIGVSAVLTGFVLLVLPCLIARPVARWLTKRWVAWRGTDQHRRHTHNTTEGIEARWPLTGVAVEPGVGVGPVQFGASPHQVEDALGPSLGYEAWDDGNLNDSLIYDGVRLRFDRCGARPSPRSRLCGAEVRRADAVLFGRPLTDWSENELVAELTRRDFRHEVSAPGYAEFSVPYLAARFEAGRLIGIEIAQESGN
ncbi:hypothetical protein J8F10_13575 [Gemmata sp. G18]|uniref:Uncharacterized protein n=1 Tax=Gemmata palustris TaxID=2822762 RepID=A0ABS5BSR8_9BACT|nr:hypothetical protein [Gemmata palustris]MBP3956315.1 hypothetical protein [Gemmata palustris]